MTVAVRKSCYNGAMMTEDEKRFQALLGLFAAQTETELNALQIELYDRNLSEYGYPAVCAALESLYAERSGKGQFPSIVEIKARMGVASTPKTAAMETTNKIVAAISSKGYNWADKVQDFEADQLRVLGEAGVAVVKRLGGWMAVIELANGNPNHFRTWIRDSALAVIESSGAKLLTLPSPDRARLEKKA